MLRSNLCHYSDEYIFAKGTVTVANTAIQGQPNNGANKRVIFKNCAPFTKCISRINNIQVNDAQYIDVVMPMYNLIEYSNNYSKTSGILWKYCRDEPVINNDGAIVDFNVANATTDSFKIKEKITGKTGNGGTKKVKIIAPLDYLSNFWRTLEMPLVNCDINLDLNWSKNCVIVANNADKDTAFSMTDRKLYVPVVTFQFKIQQLLEQLISGFKRKINWNKYEPKVSTERQNNYLDFLIDPSLQGVNRLFVLSFEDEAQRTSYKRYCLRTVQIKNYNVMIDGQNYFDQPEKHKLMDI